MSLSRRASAYAIVAVTREGQTARLLSAIRPQALIVGGDRQSPRSRAASASGTACFRIVCDLDGDIEQVIARVVESAVKRSQAPENATWWS